MDRGILQKELARRLGTDVLSVLNWEKNRTGPFIRWMPKIIDFLGYSPYVPSGSLTEWFEAVRRNLGLSQSAVARRIGIDPGTLSRWLKGLGCPPRDLRERIHSAIRHASPSPDPPFPSPPGVVGRLQRRPAAGTIDDCAPPTHLDETSTAARALRVGPRNHEPVATGARMPSPGSARPNPSGTP